MNGPGVTVLGSGIPSVPCARTLPATLRTEVLDQAHFLFHGHSDHQVRFIAHFDHRSYARLKAQVAANSKRYIPLFTNLGVIDRNLPEKLGACNAQILGSASIRGPMSVAVSTCGERVYFSSGACASERDHARIAAILSHMKDELPACAAEPHTGESTDSRTQLTV